MRLSRISAFILCGGSSSRMGQEKASLLIAGEPLLARAVRLVEPFVASVAVVGKCKQAGALGLNLIEDRDFGVGNEAGGPQGPLVGIATSLLATQTDWNLILACDLPYLTSEWLGWFLELTNRPCRLGPQVILPCTSGGLEPLAALYRRECGEPIAAALARGIRKVTDALEQLRVEYVPESGWRHIDPEGRVLRNMNNPSDYSEARRRLEAH